MQQCFSCIFDKSWLGQYIVVIKVISIKVISISQNSGDYLLLLIFASPQDADFIKIAAIQAAATIRRRSASYGGRGCEETDCIRREALLRNVKLFACGKSEALACASKDMIIYLWM
ncbi:MAG: hypothetical protein E7054_02640 [Lentisphaerae bacterium]|nr:hypothetical protein [Lentisphaerota bacterium]